MLKMARRRLTVARREERGVVAIITAFSMVLLCVAAAMVLDLGLLRVDAQANKSAADAASSAGIANLDTGDGKAHPYAGVCAALDYLKANMPELAGMAETWTDGTGASSPYANPCTDGLGATCKAAAGNQGTWAVFHGTSADNHIHVTIQNGYDLAASGYTEEDLPAVHGDTGEPALYGCDNLAVIITQARDPGLGSLASQQMSTTTRSVARVKLVPGGDAPALLLLKRHGCPVLSTGSNSGGKIAVKGAVSSSGQTQPGTIHADTDGFGCAGGAMGTGSNIYYGRFGNGIVAYAAPVASCPTPTTCVASGTADSTKPGSITTYAASKGKTGQVLRDDDSFVCGSPELYGVASPCSSAARTVVSGGGQFTRSPTDTRYLDAVQSIVNNAKVLGNPASPVSAWTMTAGTRPAGWGLVSSCAATSASIPNVANVFVDCTDNNGFNGASGGTTFPSNVRTVVFNGRINPSAEVSLPTATHVYIEGITGKDSIDIGSSAAFRMHTAGNTVSGQCSNGFTGPDTSTLSTNKAVLVVHQSDIKENSGTIQMCYTTVLMEGSDPGGNACLNDVSNQEATGPNTATPCSGTIGDGQLSLGGTPNIDWTAPNQYNVMTLPDGTPDPVRAPGWKDSNGPEDLAFWSESGSNSSHTYNMNGSAAVHIVGVYMVPNAEPFNLGGSANFDLTNAQFIASSFALGSNNTNLYMQVDPNSAVQAPKLLPMGLVR